MKSVEAIIIAMSEYYDRYVYATMPDSPDLIPSEFYYIDTWTFLKEGGVIFDGAEIVIDYADRDTIIDTFLDGWIEVLLKERKMPQKYISNIVKVHIDEFRLKDVFLDKIAYMFPLRNVSAAAMVPLENARARACMGPVKFAFKPCLAKSAGLA
jgi:hypothetical protein